MSNHVLKLPKAAPMVEQLEDRLVPDAAGFVTGLYHDLLHRAPDAAGLSTWVQQIAHGASNQQVATDIWRAPEHRVVEVAGYYQTFLNRPADPAGLAFWVNRFLTGQDDELSMEGRFVTSQEYQTTHSTPAAYITGLYLAFLDRTPAISEQTFWQGRLATRGANSVAADISTSTEAYVQVLDQYYQDYLHRAPDSTGLSNWLNQLQTGQGTVESVAESILGSPEYANLH